jgi:hypothetical protein
MRTPLDDFFGQTPKRVREVDKFRKGSVEIVKQALVEAPSLQLRCQPSGPIRRTLRFMGDDYCALGSATACDRPVVSKRLASITKFAILLATDTRNGTNG